MISLNLLSPQQKTSLQIRIMCVLAERIVIAVVICTALLTTAFIVVRIGLANQLKIAEGRRLLSNEYNTINKDTRDLNAAAVKIEKAQSESVALSPVVHDIVRRVPAGIQISSLNVDAGSHGFSISGLAETRDRLLELGDDLRASPYVTKLDNPLNNLFQKTDARFTMTGVLQLSGSGTSPNPKP